MVSGAVRTDFILSAEIMAIALAELTKPPAESALPVAEPSFWLLAASLALVAVAITIGVYGVVGIIVKMDDVGLNMAGRATRGAQAFGRGLVRAMPKVLKALSLIGIAAMIWVGGGIIVHGLEEFGVREPGHTIHDLAVGAGHALPAIHGLAEWVVGAIGAGLVGLLLGGILVAIHHAVARPKTAH